MSVPTAPVRRSMGRPIGVFDSGIGGLSVLAALRAELPDERFVYLADSGHAPYGERSAAFVRERSSAIADYLRNTHHVKALVVACNTATAAAIDGLRAAHPGFPLVGLEPALKPALARTRTGRIGVIGTRATLESDRFRRLLNEFSALADFVVVPCDGLAGAIEFAERDGPGSQSVQTLCAHYLGQIGRFGTQPGQIDTLVLGCTHYPFAVAELRSVVGADVALIDTGEAVARQTRSLLQRSDLLAAHAGKPIAAAHLAGLSAQKQADGDDNGWLTLVTSGGVNALASACARWLGECPSMRTILSIK